MRSDRTLADGNDTASARAADNAEQIRLKILAARVVPVSPQTLALPASLGQPIADVVPPAVVAKVANASAADRPAEWEKAKADRLAFGRALVSWVADDPFARDRDLLRTSREGILALSPTLIVPGHGAPFTPGPDLAV